LKAKAITLLELLIVIALIAVLAGAMIGPIFRESKIDAQEAKARKELEAIKLACIQYHYDTGKWPPTADVEDALVLNQYSLTNWRGPYIDKSDPKDPWNNDYIFVQDSPPTKTLWAVSPGPDYFTGPNWCDDTSDCKDGICDICLVVSPDYDM